MAKPLIPISRRQAIIFACFLVLYEFLTYIANDMIMPGMIGVVRSFNAPESMVATSLTMYILGGASLQLILGPVSDAYGRRPVMLLGAALFFAFTLLIDCSQSMNQFLIARYFQGMGLCFIGVIGYATLQEIFAEMDAIRFIAIMANAAILAPLLGPLIGAVVIHYTSWRWIFAVIAVWALFAFWGLWKYMPEPIGQTKHDGEVIKAIPLSISSIYKNYKSLLTNLSFVLATVAGGMLALPCMAWIGLSPVMIVIEAKQSVIEYGLWQIPVFGATILGNWALHRLTYKFSIKRMIAVGSVLLLTGLILCALLPLMFGNHYLYLLPGIIVYFFALSLVNAPLNRYCLFVTSVSKGTASAAMSLTVMIVMAIGIEVANTVYASHNNLYFGYFCLASGVLFSLFVTLMLMCAKEELAE